MENYDTLKSIYLIVGELRGKVDVGFDNIINRLDKMNDSIAKNTADIGDLQSEKWKIKGMVLTVGVIGGIIGTLAGLLLIYFEIIT